MVWMHGAKEILERMMPKFYGLNYGRMQLPFAVMEKVQEEYKKYQFLLTCQLDIQAEMTSSTWTYDSEIQVVVDE